MSEQNETIKNVRFLKLSFEGLGSDKPFNFQIPHPREDLTKEIIEAAMNIFISTGIFEKEGIGLGRKLSAEIIERTVSTTDFDISA